MPSKRYTRRPSRTPSVVLIYIYTYIYYILQCILAAGEERTHGPTRLVLLVQRAACDADLAMAVGHRPGAQYVPL